MNKPRTYAAGWVARATVFAATGFAALWVSPPAGQAAAGRAPYLLIPQLGAQIEANDRGAFTSPPESIREIALLVPYGGSHVGYGSVHTKVNTESADMVMTSTSRADGLELKLDLAGASGFPFKTGRNSVELEFKDQFGRQRYFNYLLDFGSATHERGVTSGPYTEAPPEKRAGRLFAVVIGISHYQSRRIPALENADKDAQDFIDFLKSPQGGKLDDESSVVLLNEQATLANINRALSSFLTRPQPQDTVVIYIAGHGEHDHNDQRNPYLLTSDSNLDDMEATAYRMYELPGVYKHTIKAKRVITFADTCHSFGFSGAMNEGPRKVNNLVSQYLERSASEGERAFISASDVSEEAQEGPQWGGGHGVFTYYLLKGLKGDADRNHDGVVTAGELFSYLSSAVPQATQGSQNPRAVLGSASGLPLSLLRPSGKPAQQPSHSGLAQ